MFRQGVLCFTLVLPLMVTAGCAKNRTDASPTSALLDAPLEPGQRIEALIIEPASRFKQRRVQGVINQRDVIVLPLLGTFHTQDKTLAQLEQDVLLRLNHGRDLVGTVRLSMVSEPQSTVE
jgi:protein involved in polysaccharide export with SLBB domain